MEETLKLLAVAWLAINVGFVFGALWGSRTFWPVGSSENTRLDG